MARKNKTQVENYVLMPRKRWGRRILRWGLALLLPTMLVAGHWWQGERQEEALLEDMLTLAKMGEPMFPSAFDNVRVPDGENAAPLFCGAGVAVDDDAAAWKEIERLDLRPPLGRRERQLMQRVVEQNRPALAMLEAARGKKGVDWGQYYSRPMCDTWARARTDRAQFVLGRLVEVKLLLAHDRGEDREAMQCVSDLLMLSAAREKMLPGYSHSDAAGISSMVCERIVQVAPDLRIGTGDAMAGQEEVLKIIFTLSDESSLVEGQMRELQWKRATHAETAWLVHDDRVRPRGWRDLPLPMQFLVYAARPQAIDDARKILRRSTEVVSAAQASENWPSFCAYCGYPLAWMEEIDRNSGWQMIARTPVPDYQRLMKQHYMRLAERRLAATALAIRLYTVEHDGRFPARLDELTPAYLAAVPADPLARRGVNIQYIADTNRLSIYSVGDNGRDDGGSDKCSLVSLEYRMAFGEDAVAHLRVQPRKHIEREQDEKITDTGDAGGYSGADRLGPSAQGPDQSGGGEGVSRP